MDAVIGKILTSIFDDSFIANSFGFRPKKSAHQAIEMCHKLLTRGSVHTVVEVDFSNFFNTIPHKKLMELVEKKIANEKLLRLVKNLLRGKTAKQNGRTEYCHCGTPKGVLRVQSLLTCTWIQCSTMVFEKSSSGHNRPVCRRCRLLLQERKRRSIVPQALQGKGREV